MYSSLFSKLPTISFLILLKKFLSLMSDSINIIIFKMTEKKFNFWKFNEESVEILNPLEGIDFNSQTLLTPEEMNKNNEVLKNKVDRYKDDPCYGFLKGFYEFYIHAGEAKDDQELAVSYNNSLTCLGLFSQCYEMQLKSNNEKINI
jgi:hypothetical protein